MTIILENGLESSGEKKGERGDAQFVPVPDDGPDSPFGRISAFVAQIAQDHISSSLPFLQRSLWIALGEFDAASVPLKERPRSDDRESFVDVGFGRLPSSWMTSRVVESRGEIGFQGDDDVDAFSKRVRKRGFLLNGGRDESGVGFSISFGYRIKVIVTQGVFRVVVAFCFVPRQLVVQLSAVDIRLESTHGGRRFPGAGPSKYERGVAARSAGCPAVRGHILLDGRGPAGVFSLS